MARTRTSSDEILAAAGLTQEDAQKLGAKVSSGSSSSSKKKSSGGTGGDTGAAGLSDYAQSMLSTSQQLLSKGVSQTQVLARVDFAHTQKSGSGQQLTAAEAQTIKKILTGK